jgi:SprT protein
VVVETGHCQNPGDRQKLMQIHPIDQPQREQVLERTRHFVSLAAELLERPFDPVEVRFDLKGTAAGMFCSDAKQCWIRYNPWIFAKYYEENLQDTVPHEVAHYIVQQVYGRRRVKPHGVQWRTLMDAFGANPEVTFSRDLEGIPRRRQQTHPYRCDCRNHEVSSTRHNRVVSGRGEYRCRYCNSELVYSGVL